MTKNVDLIRDSLKKRNRSEKNFKLMGVLGIFTSLLFLSVILFSIFNEGKNAFYSTKLQLEVFFDEKIIDPQATRDIEEIRYANFKKIITNSLKIAFPEIKDKAELKKISNSISSSEEERLFKMIENDIL